MTSQTVEALPYRVPDDVSYATSTLDDRASMAGISKTDPINTLGEKHSKKGQEGGRSSEYS